MKWRPHGRTSLVRTARTAASSPTAPALSLPPAAAPRAALLFSRRPHAPAPAVFGASFWAHPIWLSQPAIAAAQRGILAGGIRDQCEVVHPR